MKRNNYYGVILENGYLEDVCLSRQDAEKIAKKINDGEYSSSEYTTYSAEIVRGLSNIKNKASGNWTIEEIKRKSICN